MALLMLTPSLSVSAAHDDPVTGEPKVITGDTIEVQAHRFKLVGIEAPALGQMCRIKKRLYDCGAVSRTALLDLTAGALVICQARSKASEQPRLAQCFAADYDLSEGMVYTGWALADPSSGRAYRNIEANAKKRGRGLWRGAFISPWDWRAGKRLPEEGN